MTTKLQPVIVEWVDATTSDGWASIKDTEAMEPAPVVSIGFLVKRTKDKLTMVGDSGTGTDRETNRRISIPGTWIKRVRNIKLPAK